MSRGIKAAIGFCVIVLAVVVGFYVYYFWRFKIADSQLQHWGQTGDFFGGVLNPIFAFSSFMAVLYSIHNQRKEFEQNRIQEINLQKYNFAQDKLDHRLNMIEEIIRKKFNLKSPIRSDSFSTLMTFRIYVCNHFSSIIDEQENAKKVHDKSIMRCRSAVIAAFNVDNGELKESVKNLLAEYTFEVSSMKILYDSYSKICEELGLDVEVDPIAKYVLGLTATHLSFAYILNSVVMDDGNFDVERFIPDKEKNKILFKFFLGAMEINGLPKSAIKYFHEVKKSD